MPSFPGFTLPDELRILREQVRRFIREEIVPLEQRIDPDAPVASPTRTSSGSSAKTKAAGLWALGAPEEYGGGGLDTFSMCVVLEEMSQHRMGLYSPGCGVFGRYPPPAIWAGTQGADREVRGAHGARGLADVLRHHRAVGRRRSRPAPSSAAPSGAATSGC